jgi:hypothetical protein
VTELDYIFAVPTRTHMNYQVKTVAPYWVKTQILRRKGLEPPVLYKLDQVSNNAAAEALAAKVMEQTQKKENDSPA